MAKSCFQVAADLLSKCDQQRLECAGVANWPWSGDQAQCHWGNAFVAWESTCCGEEISKKNADCFELPECEASPREAGLLLVVAVPVVLAGILLLVRCLCQRQVDSRELQESHETEMAATQEKGEGLSGAPPAHWGGGLALGPRASGVEKKAPESLERAVPPVLPVSPKPRKSEKRKSERVTFRTQDSVMEFPTPSVSSLQEAPEPAEPAAPAAPAAAAAPAKKESVVPKAAIETPGAAEASTTTPAAAPASKGGGKGPAKGAKGSAEGSPEAASTTTPEAAPASKGGKGSAKAAGVAACDPNRGETITGANLEEEVTLWIQAVSGDSRGDETFGKWLKDGWVLCSVANKIQPGIIPNVNSSKMPFKQMENVTAFIQACRKLGVLEKDVFSTVDLFEAKNLASVQRCIFNLGAAVRRTAPDFQGPFLGVAQNAKVGDKKRESQVLTQYTGLRQDIADELRSGHNVRVAGQGP